MMGWWIYSLITQLLGSDKPHLPLGHQSHAVPVEQVAGFLPPQEFFNNYVVHGVPVVLKGAAAAYPAVRQWSDQYFLDRTESESWMVGYEVGKKETRQGGQEPISFSEYIQRYSTEDLYCVTGLPRFLRADVPVYESINCEIITQRLMDDMVLWFSSGGTRSVWHYDDYENLNCIMQGTKELILANRSEIELGHFDVPQGSYSSVDVDAVDLDKYPDFAKIRFYNATIEAGDCVYIPSFWPHTVKSFGRNIAINAWWELYKKPITCSDEGIVPDWSKVIFKTDSDLGDKAHQKEDVDTNAPRALAGHIRAAVWVSRPLRTRGVVNVGEFVEIMGDAGEMEDEDEDINVLLTGTKEIWERMFAVLDSNNDGVLVPVEVHQLEDDVAVLSIFSRAKQGDSKSDIDIPSKSEEL